MGIIDGGISNLLSLGAKLLSAFNTSAQAPSSSSSPAVDQNVKIKAELDRLMRLLERIRATLYDAEQRETRDLQVKLWLKDLKGIAYDAEDVLDEYHYEVLRAQVEARDTSPPDFHERKLIQVPYGMLNQIQQIRNSFDEISNHRIALQLLEGDGPRRCNNELQIAPTSHFVNESNIFGREGEKEKLIDLLSSQSHDVVSVVTIVGMGGIGKTTLAQLAYNDKRIKERFDKYGWICVSEDFSVERLTKESVESITKNECVLTNFDALQEKIKNEISGKRVLLVLDDVWNEKKSLWDSFQAPFMKAAFVKILVTTRNDRVAQIMQTEPTFNVGCLSPEQCWRLFEHYAFGGVEHSKSPHLVQIGKQIMNKCGMLPLAVKSIASLLRHEAEEESWRDILQSELWESKDVCNEIFPSLQISYVHLPTYLKSCFLYCCMFPKDYHYDVEYMVKLWLCQGFIESKGNKTAEQIGFEYAQQLCQRSLFERIDLYDGGDSAEPRFKLHDIVHDLAQLNSENICYSIEVGKLPTFPNKLYHLYIAYGVNLIDLIPSDKLTALRTLIIGHSVKNVFSTFDFSMVPKLRALEWRSGELESLSSIGILKHLRYLALDDLCFETIPEYICSLYSLQNLTLRHYNLKELPTKIGNLIRLEELIIDDCSKLTVLPESLCQLKALRKFFISSCPEIDELPNNIGNLVSLDELRIEDMALYALPESLCQLKALRKFFISRCPEIDELPNNIGNLVSLEELQIEEMALYALPESLCQLKALRKFFISSCPEIDELPNNIGNLVSLEELRIEETALDVLPESLCQLKALGKLCLIKCKKLEELPSDMGSLTNLQTLQIRYIGLNDFSPSLRKCVGIERLKVELECETIGWLKDFPDLGGTLCLCSLEDIVNLKDAQCANLLGMRNLEHLILSWTVDEDCWSIEDGDDFWDRAGSVFVLTIKSDHYIFLEDQGYLSIMDSLQPHPNLSKLQINYYDGTAFPDWIGNLCRLKYLNISFSFGLQILKAEWLPLQLEELEIDSCFQLVTMPGIQKLKSLVKLSIGYCENLSSFMEPSLELSTCSYGSSLLGLRYLPSLKSLKISSCLKLEVLEDELLPVEPCNIEVYNCPGLRQWCLRHGINYRDEIKGRRPEGS